MSWNIVLKTQSLGWSIKAQYPLIHVVLMIFSEHAASGVAMRDHCCSWCKHKTQEDLTDQVQWRHLIYCISLSECLEFGIDVFSFCKLWIMICRIVLSFLSLGLQSGTHVWEYSNTSQEGVFFLAAWRSAVGRVNWQPHWYKYCRYFNHQYDGQWLVCWISSGLLSYFSFQANRMSLANHNFRELLQSKR